MKLVSSMGGYCIDLYMCTILIKDINLICFDMATRLLLWPIFWPGKLFFFPSFLFFIILNINAIFWKKYGMNID